MKKVTAILVCVFCLTSGLYAQVAVFNPQQFLQDQLNFAEQKQWEMNAAMDRAEQLEKLRQQLEELQETKRNVEKAYRLQEQIQEDLKVLGSVADGGIHSLANAFQTVLGMPINPNSYIPNIPEFQGLRNALDYEASSYLSSNTRRAHKELFTYNYHDPENRDGTSITKNLRAFGKSTANLLDFSSKWKEYEEEKEAKAILQNNELANQLREMAKKLGEELQTDGLYSMSDAERMEFMLRISEMYEKADQLEQEVIAGVKEKIEMNLPGPGEMMNLVEEGFRIKMANTLRNTLTPYKARNKFSLANFERSYSQGQAKMKLEESPSDTPTLKHISSGHFQKRVATQWNFFREY